MRKSSWYFAALVAGIVALSPGLTPADDTVKEQDSAQVMHAFAEAQEKGDGESAVADKTKRQIMFLMGVPLLLLLIATAAFGIATGVYGKQLFVAHMLCAGLSLTLALAHAVVGVVWFYPF